MTRCFAKFEPIEVDLVMGNLTTSSSLVPISPEPERMFRLIDSGASCVLATSCLYRHSSTGRFAGAG